MRPVAAEMFVAPGVMLSAARELMQTNGIGSLAVVDDKGELVGFLQNGKMRASRKRRAKIAPGPPSILRD
jgi:CBS domain-containing protein